MLGEECAEGFRFLDFADDVLLCGFDFDADGVGEFVEFVVGSNIVGIDFNAAGKGLLVGLLVVGVGYGGCGCEEAEGWGSGVE